MKNGWVVKAKKGKKTGDVVKIGVLLRFMMVLIVQEFK